MKERTKEIKTASWIGIIGNTILAILKIVIGFISGSMAVIGDGIDTATDVVTYFITLIAARIMNKPPNYRFAYGYNRAEAVATKALSFVIFFAGAQLFLSTITSIIKNVPHEMPSFIAIYVTIFSIVSKAIMAIYQFHVGRKIQSNMLIANAKNMRNDILISSSVLTGLVFTQVLHLPVLDLITALAVSIWIMKIAFGIFMETSRELMDGIDDTNLYYKIFDAVEDIEGASNPHKVRIRRHSNMYTIALDIEVDGNKSIFEGHRIAREVEIKIMERIENIYDVMVHTEPTGNIEKEKFGVSRGNIDDECKKNKNAK
ncbi:MAG: cation transporter [Bacteroidetes bacterium GWC2_33_15]|nr:MAG: cation transporter [Bacteroidetes bacterium GWA2_33_15]OFX51222.1 MAG: cation transporter [Bacteroidetes bacterium GWC2_33_15]OFX66332.1 MAG: cation transporter [Bacteroidetes bacterium GWB2_32_14]OFX70625.1 MAG: cation transporter [Bacteroidetes bacterium GWD2_33_33]HAN18791.1 cation transporter [Bacteroidales bacterium]